MNATREDSLVLLEALLASAPVGIAFLDGNLCVVRMNEALANAVGCTLRPCSRRRWRAPRSFARRTGCRRGTRCRRGRWRAVPRGGRGNPRAWRSSMFEWNDRHVAEHIAPWRASPGRDAPSVQNYIRETSTAWR